MQISVIFDNPWPIRQGESRRLTLVASTTKPGKQAKTKELNNYETSYLQAECLNTPWPESHSVLVAHELARYKIDIVALSKLRFSDHGQLADKGVGSLYLFL
jgi:hypothetical protein